ncbi:MAG: alcohol dehydrogenase catalytic domain-containing protein [Planctomycetota bacterium]
MRALRVTDGGLELDRGAAEPKAPAGEVVIRPTCMGVCSTDLELCRGYMDFSGTLGHEFVGVVESAKDVTDRVWVGKRVVGRINCVCGECDMCRRGLPEHCRNRTVLGIAGRDGCFADRFALPAANLLAVPDGVSDEQAVFAEPLAAAFQVLRQLVVEGRPYITVLGDGRLGLLCTQVMARLNATVRCVGKHPEKLALCERWGIKSRPLDEVGLRQDQDIVVDCTGSPSGLATAVQMVRPRGTIVLKTTVAGESGLAAATAETLAALVVNEITVLGSRCGPFEDALAALAADEIDVTSLISRRVRLDDGAKALKLADQPGVVKVLVTP